MPLLLEPLRVREGVPGLRAGVPGLQKGFPGRGSATADDGGRRSGGGGRAPAVLLVQGECAPEVLRGEGED